MEAVNPQHVVKGALNERETDHHSVEKKDDIHQRKGGNVKSGLINSLENNIGEEIQKLFMGDKKTQKQATTERPGKVSQRRKSSIW